MFHDVDGSIYIELEWANGGDLKQLLKRHNESTPKAHFSEWRIWNFFVQVCRGVHHMHEKSIMHRDLKPANILVMKTKYDYCLKIADLGLGRKIGESFQETHSRVGTPLYMAPEVLTNQGYAWSSDVWSMGCILYELICLISPFKSGGRDSEEDDDIGRLVSRVCAAKFPSISDLLPYSKMLREFVSELLIPDPKIRPNSKKALETAEKGNFLTDSSRASNSPPIRYTEVQTDSNTESQNKFTLSTASTSTTPPPPSVPTPPLSLDAKFRPPALSIPGEQLPPSILSPHSARVLMPGQSPDSARFRRRRYSSEGGAKASSSSEPGSVATPNPLKGKTGLSGISNTNGISGNRLGVPQSPRLTRLVSSGTFSPKSSSKGLIYGSPRALQSPKSALLQPSPPLDSPKGTRSTRYSSNIPLGSFRHRRTISATPDYSQHSTSSHSRSPAGTLESIVSDVSALTRGISVGSDEEEKRSQNDGARARGSFHRLSVSTDRETLKDSQSSEHRTTPPLSADIKRPSRFILLSSAVDNNEDEDDTFEELPNIQANSKKTDSLYYLSDLRYKKKNPFSSNFNENPYRTKSNPFSRSASSQSFIQDFRSASMLPNVSNILEEVNSAPVVISKEPGSAQAQTFKFSLWSNASAKKRSQSNLCISSIGRDEDGLTSEAFIISSPSQAKSKTESDTSFKGEEEKLPYILGDIIGEGSFARVYRAVDVETGSSVAVKQISLDEVDPESASQMEKEISMLKELSHPNLVRYINTKRVNSRLNIILEYCTEGSITRMLREFGAFPERLIRLYTKQMVDALIYLHEKEIVHRDIKGGNVLVHGDGSRGIVKLSDFGCSKKLGSSKFLEKSSKMKGTVLWMAPEAANQAPETGTASDIWSLGATIIEMATGRPPWSEDGFIEEIPALIKIATTQTPPKFPEKLSPAGLSFLKNCMEIDPKNRFTAKQLSLHEFLVLEKVVAANTAEVGKRAEIVGAAAPYRAAQRGRDLQQERESIILSAIQKVISAINSGFTSLDPSRFDWNQYLTKDVEVTLPATQVKVSGLPLVYSPDAFAKDNTLSSTSVRIDGLNSFAKLYVYNFSDTDGKQFVVQEVRNTRELIQVQSRTAMWKWEILGYLKSNPSNYKRAIGSCSATFDSTEGKIKQIEFLKIKQIEFLWDPKSFVS